MTLATLSMLDQFNKRGGFGPGTPQNIRSFYAPVDDLHGVLMLLLKEATSSIALAMYAYDDATLHQAIIDKLADPEFFVQATFDASQARGATEAALLARWRHDRPGNSIAVGHSERGEVIHLKMLVVDGLDLIASSTNWSTGGETRQDNQLTVIRDAVVAADAMVRLSLLHDAVLKQQIARALKAPKL